MPFIGQEPLTGAYHVLDSITASATATYNLQLNGGAFSPATANQLIVSLNGVIQKPGSSFNISGSQITFSSALTPSDSIDFIMALGDVLNVGTPTDGSVNAGKIASGAVTSAKLDTNISVSGTLGVTGVLTTSAGIAIPSGQGIDFSASANASGMTSEILDDYEEGTWTPTPATGTFTGDVEGYYTKIGRLVHAHCHIQTTSTISSSSNFDIGGLPYAMSTDPDSISGSLMTRYLNVSGTDQSATSFMGSGSTIIRMYVQAVDATYVRVKHNDYNNANVGIRASIVYPTD